MATRDAMFKVGMGEGLLKNRPVWHAYVQLIGDLLLVTALIYKYGRLSANLSGSLRNRHHANSRNAATL